MHGRNYLSHVHFDIADSLPEVILSSIKPRPNDHNMPINATYHNIVARNILCVFGHPVASCCNMLVQFT